MVIKVLKHLNGMAYSFRQEQKLVSVNLEERKQQKQADDAAKALRIAANEELEHVKRGVESSLYASLSPGGIAAVISFHSLEDRIVKQEFRKTEKWESLTAKPVVASHQEQRVNPRSRSAKLRVARKVG